MALVGEAHIVVRAITDKVNNDIKRGFSGAGSEGRKAGESLGSKFAEGFKSQTNANIFTRISDGIESMVPGANEARDAYRALSAAGYALGPAIGSAIGGISALIGSLGALIGSAGNAAGALAAVGNAYVAAGLGMGVAKLALGGIGKAITQSMKVQTGGARASHAAATQAIADAKAQRNARQAVLDAEKALSRTIQQNGQQMADANSAVTKAQRELNAAIEEGRKQLKDLAFQAEGAALSEQGAALDLQKARANLAAVQDLPPNNQARQEALLAYNQADLAYREAKSSAQDYASQQAKASKTGVAGTQAYQSAAENLASAQKEQAKVAQQSAQQQADAEENLAKAKQAQKDANAKTARDAAAPAGGGGGGGVDPFAKLNSYQKNFAKFLISLKPKLDELKLAASKAFLPPLQTAITILVNRAFPTVVKGVSEIGGAMGQAAITIAKAITSGANLSKLGDLFKSSSKLIGTFGSIIGNVFGIALSVLDASAPLAQHLADAIKTATGHLNAFFNTKPGKEGLTSYFKESQRTLGQFGKIFGNVFKGISGIMKANFGKGTGGDILLNFFIRASSKFADLNKAANQPALKKYFQDVAKNALPILSLLGGIVKVLGHMGTNKNIGPTFNILKQALPGLQKLGDIVEAAGPSLARLVVKVVALFVALQDSGALKIFLDTLGSIVDVVSGFVQSPAGMQLLTILGRIFAFSLAFTVAGKGASFFSKIILGDFAHGMGLLGNITTGLGAVGRLPLILGKAAKGGEGLSGILVRLADSPNKLLKKMGEVGIKGFDTFGKIKTKAGEAATAIKDFAGKGLDRIGTAAGNARDAAIRAFERTKDGVAKIGGAAVGAGKKIRTLATDAAKMGVEAAKATGKAVLGFAKMAAGAVAAAAKAVALKAAQIAISVATKIAAAAQAAFNFVMNLNPIGLVIAGITLLVGALVWFFTQTKLGQDIWANFTKFIGEAFQNTVTFLQGAIANIVKFFADFGPMILAVIAPFLGIPLLIILHWNDIVAFFQGVWAAILVIVQDQINAVHQVITDVINGIVTTWNRVWGGIRDFFGTVWRAMVAFYTPIIRGIGTFIHDTINNIVTVWNRVWGGIRDFFGTIWRAMVNFYGPILRGIGTGIGNAIGGIRDTWNRIWGGIRDFFHGIWNGITTTIGGIGTAFHNAFNGITGFVRTAFGGVLDAVRTPINGVINLVNGAIRNLNRLHVHLPSFLGGGTFGLDIPQIPKLAKGGVVAPSLGGSIVNVAEAGRPERITPLDSNGLSAGDKAVLDAVKNSSGSSVTIHVHAAPGQNEAQIAAMVSQTIAFRMRKGAVA